MNNQVPFSSFNFRSMESQLILLLFLVIWAYVIVRACTVFYTFDEIFTKWNYVVDWNPFPYNGIIDANNHFLFSVFGGLFVRIFNSENIFIVRLASVLAFPVYFWSIYGFRNFFQQKWNFYACLIALTTAPFLLEFFPMARGYGLALAFLVFALVYTMHYFKMNQKRFLYWALFGWLMSVSASLTLLPLSLMVIFFMTFLVLKRKFYFGLLAVVVVLIPLAYYIDYSFVLKGLGKLYYGGTEGFIKSTVHSIGWYLWRYNGIWATILVCMSACFILFTSLRRLWKNRILFDAKLIFPIFFFALLASILTQHWLLDVKYPMDRTALALIILFFGALFYALDEWKFGKWIGLISIGLFLFVSTPLINFSHAMLFRYEHLDAEVVEKIPASVKGTPPTTAGNWNIENELNRELGLPVHVFQQMGQPHDTLVDYVVSFSQGRPEIYEMYDIVYLDNISDKALMKRNRFLNRTKILEVTEPLTDTSESQVLITKEIEGPILIRLTGELEQVDVDKDILIDFFTQNSKTEELFSVERISLRQNKKVDNDGIMRFDFSYTLNVVDGADSFVTKIWHRSIDEIQGDVKIELYRLEE